MYLYEVRNSVKRLGPPVLLAYGQAQLRPGYISTYGYGDTAIRRIKEQGHMQDLAGYTVDSRELLVDFDNKEAEAKAFIRYLRKRSIGYTAGPSGGRSVHVHVRIEYMEGPLVPKYQEAWCAKNAHGCDMSIYHVGGVFRTWGTIHEKTGRPKEVQEVRKGKELIIPPELPVKAVVYDGGNEAWSMENWTWAINHGVAEGGRVNHVFVIGKIARSLRLSERCLVDAAVRWNNQYCLPPLPQTELLKHLRIRGYK